MFGGFNRDPACHIVHGHIILTVRYVPGSFSRCLSMFIWLCLHSQSQIRHRACVWTVGGRRGTRRRTCGSCIQTYPKSKFIEMILDYKVLKLQFRTDRPSSAGCLQREGWSSSTNLSLTWTEAAVQPLLLKDKLTKMGVDSHLVAWIANYYQYVSHVKAIIHL